MWTSVTRVADVYRRIGRANAEFQLVRALLDNRKQRSKQKRFLIQSVSAITAAVAAGWRLESVWVREGAELSRWAQEILASPVVSTRVLVSADLFAELSEKAEPGELI